MQDNSKRKARPDFTANESGRNPKNHEESHYSESERQLPGDKAHEEYHGAKHSEALHHVASVLPERLKQNRSSCHLAPPPNGGRVPKQEEPRYRQESIIMRAHGPEEPADIRRAKTAKGVTGSPNKKGIGQYDGRRSQSQPWNV
ncbi:hypothetical protein Tco_1553549 [Tanacetum coccineum]